MDEPIFHDVKWFAARIGMSEQWVRAHLHEIPHHKLGRNIRFTDANLNAYVAKTAQEPVDRTPPGGLTPRSWAYHENKRRRTGHW